MGYVKLRPSQIEFLKWIFTNKSKDLESIEITRIQAALRDGVYTDGGKRRTTFNELRDYYLMEYEQYLKR